MSMNSQQAKPKTSAPQFWEKIAQHKEDLKKLQEDTKRAEKELKAKIKEEKFLEKGGLVRRRGEKVPFGSKKNKYLERYATGPKENARSPSRGSTNMGSGRTGPPANSSDRRSPPKVRSSSKTKSTQSKAHARAGSVSAGADKNGPDKNGPDSDGPDSDRSDSDGSDSDGADSDGANSDGADSDGADSDGADNDGADNDGAVNDGADDSRNLALVKRSRTPSASRGNPNAPRNTGSKDIGKPKQRSSSGLPPVTKAVDSPAKRHAESVPVRRGRSSIGKEGKR